MYLYTPISNLLEHCAEQILVTGTSNCSEKQHCLNCDYDLVVNIPVFQLKDFIGSNTGFSGFIDQENVSEQLLSKHFLTG